MTSTALPASTARRKGPKLRSMQRKLTRPGPASSALIPSITIKPSPALTPICVGSMPGSSASTISSPAVSKTSIAGNSVSSIAGCSGRPPAACRAGGAVAGVVGEGIVAEGVARRPAAAHGAAPP